MRHLYILLLNICCNTLAMIHFCVYVNTADECSEEENYSDDINYDNYLQLIVPEGRVVALSKGDFSQVLWEHKVSGQNIVSFPFCLIFFCFLVFFFLCNKLGHKTL